MIGEYLNIVLMCAMINILFLGGWHAPWGPVDNPFFGFIIFTVKIWVIFFMFAMVKAIVPRYRYDQLMRLGWKIFLPTALVAVAAIGYYVTFMAPATASCGGRLRRCAFSFPSRCWRLPACARRLPAGGDHRRRDVRRSLRSASVIRPPKPMRAPSASAARRSDVTYPARRGSTVWRIAPIGAAEARKQWRRAYSRRPRAP